jgi:hypothetical protein
LRIWQRYEKICQSQLRGFIINIQGFFFTTYFSTKGPSSGTTYICGNTHISSNCFTTQHIYFLCHPTYPATALPHSTSTSSVTPHIQQPLCLTAALSTLCSRNGPFMPHQRPVVVHLTTPTTLPANEWQSKRNSRSTV